MKVLVVDDDPSISEFVGWVLSDEGHEIQKAPNGLAALEILKGYEPDVILLDMRMPVMDAWQFVGAYRDGRQRCAPIVVMTAADDSIRRAREIKADGVLAKPFNIDDLVAIVERFRPPNNGEG